MPEKLWVVMWRRKDSNGPWRRWIDSDVTCENEAAAIRRAESFSFYHSDKFFRVVSYVLAEQEKEQL